MMVMDGQMLFLIGLIECYELSGSLGSSFNFCYLLVCGAILYWKDFYLLQRGRKQIRKRENNFTKSVPDNG